MAGQQVAKRIPSIKFPNRRANKGGAHSSPPPPAATAAPAASASAAFGGSASIQPRRTPVSKEEIDAILLGGGIS